MVRIIIVGIIVWIADCFQHIKYLIYENIKKNNDPRMDSLGTPWATDPHSLREWPTFIRRFRSEALSERP